MDEMNIIETLFSFFDFETLLALIGAAAWIPTIYKNKEEKEEKERIENRKIEMNIFDYVLIDKVSKETCNDIHVNGSLLMLAVNLYIPDKSFFAKSCTIKLDLVNGFSGYGYIVDGSFKILNRKGTKKLNIPHEYNFNLHREIIHDKDNIRIIAIEIPNKSIQDIANINGIKFTLTDRKNQKDIVITTQDFPCINTSDFLDKFRDEKILFGSND